jgi:hypothetical protein
VEHYGKSARGVASPIVGKENRCTSSSEPHDERSTEKLSGKGDMIRNEKRGVSETNIEEARLGSE